MLKGHADIFLMDAKTGEVVDERHEDNIVTNAVQDLLSMNPFGARRGLQEQIPLATGALGGVLLFPNAITESTTDYFAHNQWPTGYAGQNSDPDGNPLRGNFNPNESYATSNGYRLVWDFGTADANGDIACICLTHKYGGQNYEQSQYGSSEKYTMYADRIKFLVSGNENSQYVSAYNNGYFYRSEWGSGSSGSAASLTIRKWAASPHRQPVNRSFDFENSTTEYIDLSNTHVIVPGSGSGGSYWKRNEYWDKYGMRIFSTDDLSTMSTGYWYVTTVGYDGTVSEVAIPYGDMSDIKPYAPTLVYNGWCYIAWSRTVSGTIKNGFYAVELANTSNIIELESSITGHSLANNSSQFAWRADVNTPIAHYDIGGSNRWRVVVDDGKILAEWNIPNASSFTSQTYGNFGPYIIPFNTSSGNELNMKTTYLATINNLGTPITKTADRTLKIVYTLTEA